MFSQFIVVATNSTCVTHEVIARVVSEGLVEYIILQEMLSWQHDQPPAQLVGPNSKFPPIDCKLINKILTSD